MNERRRRVRHSIQIARQLKMKWVRQRRRDERTLGAADRAASAETFLSAILCIVGRYNMECATTATTTTRRREDGELETCNVGSRRVRKRARRTLKSKSHNKLPSSASPSHHCHSAECTYFHFTRSLPHLNTMLPTALRSTYILSTRTHPHY